MGGAAPAAIPTNAVITAVDIPRKYRPPLILKVGSCSRSTARRDFQLAKEANEPREREPQARSAEGLKESFTTRATQYCLALTGYRRSNTTVHR